MRFKAELEDYFLSFSENGISVREMASRIFEEENGIRLSKGTIMKYLYKIKKDQTEAIVLDDTPAWKVVGDNYIFEIKGSRKVFSVSQIDELHLFYTRRGYDFTRSAVQQRFQITPKTFAAIQRTFHLSKESDIISPYTKQNTSIEELSALTDQLMEDIVNSGEMTTRKMQKALERRYKKIIQKDNQDHVWHNEAISEVITEWPNVETTVLKKTVSEGSPLYKEIDVNIADIHAGSKADKMKITQDWSIAILEEKLDRVAEIVNSYNCPKVHLNFLGDLVETVSGVNHPDSWKLIEDGHYGSKAIIEATNLLVRFISKVENIASINGVGGNHDRLQGSNKLADTGATDLIFHMLGLQLGEVVDINYDPILLGMEREGYGNIIGHGDKGIHKRSVEFQILSFAENPKQFQFINSGHFHSFMVKDSQYCGRSTVNPSIITGNPYSDSTLGKSDRSGFSINAVNKFGEPDQLIHNI
jgi:hypothetical protein